MKKTLKNKKMADIIIINQKNDNSNLVNTLSSAKCAKQEQKLLLSKIKD